MPAIEGSPSPSALVPERPLQVALQESDYRDKGHECLGPRHVALGQTHVHLGATPSKGWVCSPQPGDHGTFSLLFLCPKGNMNMNREAAWTRAAPVVLALGLPGAAGQLHGRVSGQGSWMPGGYGKPLPQLEGTREREEGWTV